MPGATGYFHSPTDGRHIRIRTNTALIGCESLGIMLGDNDVVLFLDNKVALEFYTKLLGICAKRIHELTEELDSDLVNLS